MIRSLIRGVVAWTVFAMSGVALAAPATQPAVVFDIPYLPNVQIDGQSADWGDAGLHIDSLATLDPAKPAAGDTDAHVRLAWNDHGLVVLATVHDRTPKDVADLDGSDAGDSVELIMAGSLGAWNRAQTVIAPRLETQKDLAWVVHVRNHHEPGPTTRPGGAAAPQVARATIDGGYVLEILLPWDQLDQKPQPGSEIGLQLIVCDAGGHEPRRLYWFPSNRARADTSQMQRAGLAQAASEPIKAAAVASYDRLRRLTIGIVADASRGGASVQVRDAASPSSPPLASAKLDQAARPSAVLKLPLPPVGQPIPQWTVRVGFDNLGPLVLPDLPTARQQALTAEKLTFRSYVFDGATFPAAEFDRPAEVEDEIGQYTISTTYYDRAFQPTTRPATAGRYGAVSEVKNTAGEVVDRRFATLYRSPKKLNLRGADLHLRLTLPEELGLDPTVLDDQQTTITQSLTWNFAKVLSSDDSYGTLFAGLSELTPGAVGVNYASASRIDDRWWHDLHKTHGWLTPYKYLEHLPPGYYTTADASKRWPLILFLHGSGERGSDPEIVRLQGLPLYLESHQDLPFVVISPQCPRGRNWSPALLSDLLDEVMAKYAIDPDRVYLSGLSMGGFGTWALSAAEPDRFAAVAPIAGGGDPLDATRLKALPMWIFHGQADPTVPIELDERSVAALKQAGGDVTFTTYPGVGHDSWTQTYENPALYEWFLSHTRVKAK